MTDIFPRGVAKGEAFYNRNFERSKLKQNIANTIHTVLIAPRRFGKTSLMTQVLHENKIKHIWVDFMTITSREDVQLKLLQKIGNLIIEVVPVVDKLKKLLHKYFSKLKPEITLDIPGVRFSLKLSHEGNIKEGIAEALIGLDSLAKELKIRLVVVFDEFQEILRIDQDATLQGTIRHAVERAKGVTYLFSGSKHRPLRRMFNGKENPLYSLCEVLELNKIAKDEYISYMNAAAIKKWGKPLKSNIIDIILTHSDCYPRYINVLCSIIWIMETMPTTKTVDNLWNSYIISKKTDITEDLASLTLNQRRLLQWLCFNPTAELYKKETLAALKMSQSSIQKSIKELLEKDFVTEKNGIYKVLDPIWGSYFKMF